MKEQLALLPGYLAAHVRLVIVALIVCFAVSVPIGVLATRSARVERVAVGLASIIQTVPALALLAVMVPLLGYLGAPAIGVVPALLGLTLYSALPILLATITGLREVDPAIVEAARGVGMTERQVLRMVELPLALPFIVAGTRTAAVWSVGMATLSTPIGAPSLGNFIFGGLQTRNHAATLVGCTSAAVLALVLDGLVTLVERGLRRRRRGALLAGLGGLGALAAFTVVTLVASATTRPQDRPVRVGTKPFTESFILGHALALRAESTGAKSEVVESLGSTVAFDALAAGDLDAYVDYSGTLWTTVLKRTDLPADRATLLSELRAALHDRFGVELVATLGFENTYCLAVRAEDADQHGWRTVSDLAASAPTLSIGGDYEFFSRPEWASLKAAYSLGFRDQRSMDPALMYQAAREGQVDVISAFSTDGRIATYHLRVLEDDRHVIPPYDAVVLVSARLARERPDVVRAMAALEGKIDAPAMQELNRKVDADKLTPREVARSLAR
ncbi:MAG: glycine betaine ABC transporter substrate-binding protein [Polyangiaceae bacterium]